MNTPTPKKRATKQKLPKISEKAIETQILTWLMYKGIFSWKINRTGVYDVKRGVFRKPVSRFELKGIPDICGVFLGKPLFIEVKAKDGRVSPDQQAFLQRAQNEGALCLVAKSVEDVEEFLKRVVVGTK